MDSKQVVEGEDRIIEIDDLLEELLVNISSFLPTIGDRIIYLDDLPEELLASILSFLPTKDALQASILSRRWRYLWKCFHSYDFQLPINPNQKELFTKAIERVLSLRDSSNIRRFSLSYSVDEDDDVRRIHNWLCIVFKHKVEELNLRVSGRALPLAVPSSLFTCESLAVLNLDMFVKDLNLPSRMYFPSLKVLSLRQVSLPDDNSIHRLLSGCPGLKELAICGCFWENVTNVRIAIPSLEKLKVFERTGEPMHDCKVVIVGTKLKDFKYAGELQNDYCLSDLSSSLVYSSFFVNYTRIIGNQPRQREVAHRAHKLLRGVSKASSLWLSHGTLEALNYTQEILPIMPLLRNVVSLRLVGGVVDFACRALQKLLQNCPHLTTLEFWKGVNLTSGRRLHEWKLDPVPSCFLTDLEFIHIREFKETPAELRVVEILHSTAPILKMLTIDLVGLDEHEFHTGMIIVPESNRYPIKLSF